MRKAMLNFICAYADKRIASIEKKRWGLRELHDYADEHRKNVKYLFGDKELHTLFFWIIASLVACVASFVFCGVLVRIVLVALTLATALTFYARYARLKEMAEEQHEVR